MVGAPVTATLASLRCPKAPDGVHILTVAEVGQYDAEGRLIEGSYRRVCLLCGAEV